MDNAAVLLVEAPVAEGHEWAALLIPCGPVSALACASWRKRVRESRADGR